MDSKKYNVIIVILSIIVIGLMIVIGLFLTNKISFNNNDNVNNTTNVDSSKDDVDSSTSSSLSDSDKYASVINNYKSALEFLDSSSDYNTVSNKYPDFNFELFINGKKGYYSFYDIDKDGNNELIISSLSGNEYTYADVYTYNNGAKKLDLKIAERNQFGFYDNGVIFTRGSGGANYGGYEFYKLSNGYNLSNIGSYTYEYNNNVVSIKCNSNCNSKNYSSLDDLANDFSNNSESILSSSLSWNLIK